MDGVVHFEIPADDLARAKKFYGNTFGWSLQDVPEMNYVMATTGAVDEKRMPVTPGVIGGGMLKRGAPVTVPSFAINVKDIDASAEKVKAAGGTIVKEKSPVGDMGFIVYFKDTEGNVMSLWQTKKK
jgi:predicted enzyme related to lactoylglutathione lyase